MADYTELVKELREYWNDGTDDLRTRAADAIEELQEKLFSEEVDRDDMSEAIEYWQEQLPRWISVKERLPEPKFAREWYLVHLESGCVKTLAFEKSGTPNNLFKDGWHETASRITHWMPLPSTEGLNDA